jgi:lycopene cyclase domain-containing protein
VRHLTYVAILAGCLIITLPLEFVFGARVYARWRRLALSLLPVLVVFGGWDLAAIQWGDWHYDAGYLVGVELPGRMPLEELLFFLVIPTCAILTLEAVRSLRPGWFVDGEEPAAEPAQVGQPR